MTDILSDSDQPRFQYRAELGWYHNTRDVYCQLLCIADRRLPQSTQHLVREALRSALCSRDDVAVRSDEVGSYASTAGNTVFSVRAHYDSPLYIDEVITAAAGLEVFEQTSIMLCEVGQFAVTEAMASVTA